jgi:hypothetical protein
LGGAAAIARTIEQSDDAALALMGDKGREFLDEWIRTGSQLQTFLDTSQDDEISLIETLDASALVAGTAKDQLLHGGTFDEATKELREMTTLIEMGCAKVLGRMRAFLREGPSK